MQEPTPTIEHPLTRLGDHVNPDPYLFLVIGLAVGIFIGVAIMKVRADQKKRKKTD